MNYDTQFHKYWPNKELWEIAFNDALPNNDKSRLKWAVEQQKKEMPNREGPVTVDVFAKFCKPTFRNQAHLFEPDGNWDRDAELKFLRELAELRDEPNSEIRHLPKAYWKAAYWLKDVEQRVVSQDFLTDEVTYRNLYEKGVHDTVSTDDGYTLKLEFATLRTWGEYVHNDSPFVQWQRVVDDLLSRGFKTRCEHNMLDTCGNANHRFGTGGIVSINGLLGEAIRRLATISFAEKWNRLEARPEQYAFSKGILLPQVFPEGSPPHPSKRAMHFNAAQVCAYIMSIIFDSCEQFITGRPLYEELQLEADNISYARCSAGVHYPSDNKFKNSCRLMAEEICSDVYGEPCRVPDKMMEIDYSV